jgi:hypothetical protein
MMASVDDSIRRPSLEHHIFDASAPLRHSIGAIRLRLNGNSLKRAKNNTFFYIPDRSQPIK